MDVEDVILEVLESGPSRTTMEITRAVRERLSLRPADLKQAAKRDNEQKIDQVIANALQDHRRLCRDGLIVRIDRGEFKITEKGKLYLVEHRKRVIDMVESLKTMFPDAWFED